MSKTIYIFSFSSYLCKGEANSLSLSLSFSISLSLSLSVTLSHTRGGGE